MNYKQQNYSIKMFKLLSNHNRLKVLDYISENNGKSTVGQIAAKFDVEIKTLSGHLVKLKDNGLIKARQDNTNIYYSIKDERIIELINLAKKLA